MTQRVAFDISVLGSRFDGHDPRHGIYNVIENLLKELCGRDDLNVTAVGLSGEDPLLSSIKAGLYLAQLQPRLSCSFRQTFKAPLGLTNLYASVFGRTLAPSFAQMDGFSASRALQLAARSALYRLSYTYGLAKPRRVFDHYDYDVFHCPHIELPDREVTGKLPRIVTVYDLIPALRPDFVIDKVATDFKRNLAKIDVAKDWVVCISEFTRQEFCAYTGMSLDRCFVAPLAALGSFFPITDLEAIEAVRARYGIPEGNYFLTLGAPQPRKNLAHLIRSFLRLIEESKLQDTYLVIAGSREQGWMYDDIFDAAAESPNIIFAGYVNDADLPALYSGTAAFVFPSLYEGFGLPVLEAMACGAAVITSNTTSLPEIVGDAGIMVDPTDVDALCQSMLTVLENDELRGQLGKMGRKRAAEFSWKRCADETVKAYKTAAAG